MSEISLFKCSIILLFVVVHTETCSITMFGSALNIYIYIYKVKASLLGSQHGEGFKPKISSEIQRDFSDWHTCVDSLARAWRWWPFEKRHSLHLNQVIPWHFFVYCWVNNLFNPNSLVFQNKNIENLPIRLCSTLNCVDRKHGGPPHAFCLTFLADISWIYRQSAEKIPFLFNTRL